MTSIRRILANQANARRSTGPRTVQGRAKVILNALRSGIDAKTLVIRGENPEDFTALHQEYFDRWCPTTPEQRFLVDSLISSEWLIRRYQRLETVTWNSVTDSEVNRQSKPDFAFTLGIPAFDRINRHRNAAVRAYHSALRALERLKKEELAEAQPDPISAQSAPIAGRDSQPIEIQSTSVPIGFVPQNRDRQRSAGFRAEETASLRPLLK